MFLYDRKNLAVILPVCCLSAIINDHGHCYCRPSVYSSLRTNPHAGSPGQVKLDSDK